MFESMSIWGVLFLLLVGHALGDYALQSDFIAQAKNHTTALGKTMWRAVLPAHCAIHAGIVLVITGSVLLALIELVTHAYLDYCKCDNRLTFYQDQLAHLAVKLLIWVGWLIWLS